MHITRDFDVECAAKEIMCEREADTEVEFFGLNSDVARRITDPQFLERPR